MSVEPTALIADDRAPHWSDDAACRTADAALFFAEDATAQERAVRVCQGCAVMDACRSHALAAKQAHGVWGGQTERERRSILRRARRQRSVERRAAA